MKKKKVILISVICAVLASLALALYIHHWEYRKPLFEVYFFSLNRGRAIFIRTPQNKTILIGGGQNSESIRAITKAMPFYSRKIDYLFIPSATPAQIGGFLEILDRYEVGEIIQPKIMATSTVLSQLERVIFKKKIHVEKVEKGDQIEIGGVEVKILFPYEDFKFNKTSLPELGLVLIYENTSVYLMGNLSRTIQKDIFKNVGEVTEHNLIEFYNSVSESKVYEEFIKRIEPTFIFSTKEKTHKWISDGEGWVNTNK